MGTVYKRSKSTLKQYPQLPLVLMVKSLSLEVMIPQLGYGISRQVNASKYCRNILMRCIQLFLVLMVKLLLVVVMTRQ